MFELARYRESTTLRQPVPKALTHNTRDSTTYAAPVLAGEMGISGQIGGLSRMDLGGVYNIINEDVLHRVEVYPTMPIPLLIENVSCPNFPSRASDKLFILTPSSIPPTSRHHFSYIFW